MAFLTTKQLLSTLKESGSLVVMAGDDDVTWVSDSYWMAPASAVVVDLLSDYNLPLAPMRCSVNGTIRRDDTKPPVSSSDLLKKYAGGKLVPVTRVLLAGYPVTVLRDGEKSPSAVYERPDGIRVVVRPDYLNIVEALAGGEGAWKQRATGPVPVRPEDRPLGWIVGGKVRGLVMPVRFPWPEVQH